MTEGRLGRRLQRILLLLPYAIKHPGVSVDELSRKFGVRKQELLDDLELVFLCGLPGYGPGDLIDVALDEDRVFVRTADYFGTPFRLTHAEALALYIGGQALLDLPGMEEADALRKGLDKLRTALGIAEGDAAGVDVLLEGSPDPHLERLNAALSEHKRTRIEYLSASKGELKEREVDPWGLVAALGRWYLIGFDHLSQEERTFRIDRMKSVEMLEKRAELPEDFDPDRYKGAFVGDGDQPTMSLDISPEVARWFPDYYPVMDLQTTADGWTRVELIYSGPRWAATLLLRLGEGARDVQPADLWDEAVALAGRIAAKHGSG